MKIKLVLKIGDGNFQQGFPDSAIEVSPNGGYQQKLSCDLPPAPELPDTYKKWQQEYRGLVGAKARGFKKNYLTQCSVFNCENYYQYLSAVLNNLLNNLPIISQLKAILTSQESDGDGRRPAGGDRIILLEVNTQQVSDRKIKYLLHQLHWESWDLFNSYQVENYLSLHRVNSDSPEPTMEVKSQPVKVLGIVGDDTGIDLSEDTKLIDNLCSRGANPVFLPDVRHKYLTRVDFNQLWESRWDVLIFTGHSDTRLEGETGVIHLNPNEFLDFQEIKETLKEAKRLGLKLAIFNSCDGLGLAEQLKDLGITVIVWREPVPCKVASLFLNYFLNEFTNKADESIYRAMWAARTRLEELHPNLTEELAGVTGLPLVIHNGSQEPSTWNQLRSGQPQAFSQLQPEETALLTISSKRNQKEKLLKKRDELELEKWDYLPEYPPQELLNEKARVTRAIEELEKNIKQNLQKELPLPSQRYASFVGREKAMHEIMAALQPTKPRRIIAIDGFGGVGKTAITQEIVQRSMKKNDFYLPIWQSAKPEIFTGGGVRKVDSTTVDFEQLLTNITSNLGYVEVHQMKTIQDKRKLFREVINEENYLVVIDNLETMQESEMLVNDLDGLFDSNSNTKAIITTRKQVREFSHVKPFQLKGLELDESLEFLRVYAAEKPRANEIIASVDEDKLVTIYERTEGHPLAMELIVGKLEGGFSIDRILIELKKVNFKNCESGETIYHQFYKFILGDSWDKLSELAQTLLINIGEFNLTAGAKIDDLISVSELTLSEVEDATSQLIRWSLVKSHGIENKRTFLLHPFTYLFVQEL